jgi:hypothetical protein
MRLFSYLNRLHKENGLVWSSKKTYIQNPYMKNLVKNPSANEHFMHWCFSSSEHDLDNYFKSSDTIKSFLTKSIQKISEFDHKTAKDCWCANHLDDETFDGHYGGWTIKTGKGTDGMPFKFFINSKKYSFKWQIIDLNGEKITSDMLSALKPDIEITDRYACGNNYCTYDLFVCLISEDYKIVDSFDCSGEKSYYNGNRLCDDEVYFKNDILNENDLSTVSHTFKYKKLFRYILYHQFATVSLTFVIIFLKYIISIGNFVLL